MTDVLEERDGNVLLITLNRPERMNAIGGNLLTLLSEKLLAADHNPEVRAIVLTGAGRGFCSGLDLKDVASGETNVTNAGAAFKIGETPPLILRRIDTPVICALNGAAAGYGMDLALLCDFVIASSEARMIPPIRRGAIPESGGTWLLPRLVGWHKACEITLLGRTLDSSELERLGLVNKIVDPDQLMTEAMSWAREIAKNAPLAVAAAKRSMRLGLEASFEANMTQVLAETMQLFRSEDFGEGLSSFLEKRPAEFKGR